MPREVAEAAFQAGNGLQAFYNMEIGRYVMATGEVPSLGFGRIPPGAYVGTILAVGLFYLTFITGGWASAAGASFFTMVTGDIPGPGDLTTTRWIAVGLMAVVFAITLFGQEISRTLELVFWFLVTSILVTLFLAVLLLTPPSSWLDGIVGMIQPALPPEGTDATTIGAVAGFAAMASGLNYVFMNYYRDKGYGMGSKTGYIPACSHAASWALFIGFIILFKTQIVVFEMLTRNMVDALYGSSASFRRLIHGDPRRFYYPFMILLGVVISIIIFRALPVRLVQWAANMSNLAAMIFPFALMYLIGKLPRPARASWRSYLILALVAVFFGFWFINFAKDQLTGTPLVTF